MPDSADEARRGLAEFARSHAQRKLELDRQVEQLREERDSAILRAFAQGLTTREIAKLLGGISHQRVAQIVQGR